LPPSSIGGSPQGGESSSGGVVQTARTSTIRHSDLESTSTTESKPGNSSKPKKKTKKEKCT